ncbi:MAG: type II toxin-antitoxin system ParD family antitoxin [Planctomycetes bacterium]|nr:type II toxin-antitoxin system ParD family antitoxin [Planctomycetota bacterium]
MTLNVSLSPGLAAFVRSKVDGGLYSSASEVVREALRWFAEHANQGTDAAPTLLDFQEQRIDRKAARKAIAALRRSRKGATLGPGLTVKALRDLGRR